MWTSDPITTLELAHTSHRERIDRAARRLAVASGDVPTTLRTRIGAALRRSAPTRHQRHRLARTHRCLPTYTC